MTLQLTSPNVGGFPKICQHTVNQLTWNPTLTPHRPQNAAFFLIQEKNYITISKGSTLIAPLQAVFFFFFQDILTVNLVNSMHHTQLEAFSAVTGFISEFNSEGIISLLHVNAIMEKS